jgi:hypothetical protein
MLRLKFRRFSVKAVVFLVLVLTSGCLTLKTIPTNNISQLQPGRKYLKIHSEDSLWLIQQYKVRDNLLTGQIVKNTAGITTLSRVDVYIPSSHYVKINDGILTIPVENIGKVDYMVVDAFMVLSSISLFLILLLFSPLLFS